MNPPVFQIVSDRRGKPSIDGAMPIDEIKAHQTHRWSHSLVEQGYGWRPKSFRAILVRRQEPQQREGGCRRGCSQLAERQLQSQLAFDKPERLVILPCPQHPSLATCRRASERLSAVPCLPSHPRGHTHGLISMSPASQHERRNLGSDMTSRPFPRMLYDTIPCFFLEFGKRKLVIATRQAHQPWIRRHAFFCVSFSQFHNLFFSSSVFPWPWLLLLLSFLILLLNHKQDRSRGF